MATYEQKAKLVEVTPDTFRGLRAFLTGIAVGALIAGIAVFTHFQKDIANNYCKIYFTNIGGFVFHKNRIYHLDGMQDLVDSKR